METPLKLYKSAHGYQTLRSWYDGLPGKIETRIEFHVEMRFGRTHVPCVLVMTAGPV